MAQLERSEHMEHIYECPMSYSQVQNLIKGHDQVHMFKIYGTVGKVLSKETHMPNMTTLSLRR